MSTTVQRLDQLVSVRGLAAWWVVLFHAIALLRVALPDLHPLIFDVIAHGYLAVDFFFVLSGFIIFINYHGKFTAGFFKSSRLFYWNRLSRIYPVHLLMLLAYLVLAIGFIYFSVSKALPPTYTLSSLIKNVFLVQAWSGTSTSWNVPSWSISAEWFVYLLFPIFAYFLRRYVHSYTVHFLLVAIIIVGGGALTRVEWPGSDNLHLAQLPLVRAFGEFFLGTLVGSLYIQHHQMLVNSRLLFAGAGAIAWAILAIFKVSYADAVPLACFLLVCVMSVDRSPLTQWLTIKPLVYLGEISYSTYMVHYFVNDVYKATWLSSLNTVDTGSLFVSFGIVLVLSMIMHATVEIPAQRYLRGRNFGFRPAFEHK